MRGKRGFLRSCFGGCTSCVKHEADDVGLAATGASNAANGVKATRDVGTHVPHSESLNLRDGDSVESCEQLKKCGDVDETATEASAKQKSSLPVVLDNSATQRGSSSGSAFEERSSVSSASSVGDADEAPPPAETKSSTATTPQAPSVNAAAGEAAPPQPTRSRKGRLHHRSDVTNATSQSLVEATAGEGAPKHPAREERLSCHPILTREWSLPSSITSDEEVEGEGNASDYE